MKRSLRRHHYQRIKRKVKGYYGGRNLEEHLGCIATHRPDCSNPLCCGNPRRIRGQKCKTKQERLSELNEAEQLEGK